MNKVLSKVRRNSAIFLKALLILFITVTSFNEVSAKSQAKNKDQTLYYKSALAEQIVLRDAQATLSFGSGFENLLTFDWEFSEFIIDLPAGLLFTHKVFFFSLFERNAFYVFNSASAP